jgi:hypothetical protein
MKVVCEIRNDNNLKKIRIICSMILLFSVLFLIRVKLYSETKLSGVELNIYQLRITENSKKQILEEFYAEENKERIIVNSENKIILNSFKQKLDQFALMDQMQKNLQKIAEHLNEEQIESIYFNDLCNNEENINGEQYVDFYNRVFADENVFINGFSTQNSFSDF